MYTEKYIVLHHSQPPEKCFVYIQKREKSQSQGKFDDDYGSIWDKPNVFATFYKIPTAMSSDKLIKFSKLIHLE